MKFGDAKETIIKQLITGLGCLLVGGTLVTGFVLWANTWNMQFSDGSKYNFWSIGWLGYISMVLIVGLIIHTQFIEALTAQKVFWKSVKYSIFPGILALLLLGSLALMFGEFDILKGQIVISTAIFMVIGLTIGSLNALRLRLENFDAAEHRLYIGNEANVEACRNNLLPYRYKVEGFWKMFGLALICCVLIAGLLAVITSQNSDSGIAVLLIIGLLAVFVFATAHQIGFIQNNRLIKIDGEIRKDSWCTGRGIHLGLICNSQKLFTDSETWDEMIDGQKYVLWYSRQGTPTGSNFVGRVLAFEYQF